MFVDSQPSIFPEKHERTRRTTINVNVTERSPHVEKHRLSTDSLYPGVSKLEIRSHSEADAHKTADNEVQHLK